MKDFVRGSSVTDRDGSRPPILGVRFVTLLALVSLLSAYPRQASPEVPVPPGLGPGAKYHLVFNSSTYRNGASANIGDYDAFVQSAADAAGIGNSEGITWRAIASTGSVDARDHAVVGTSTPVFNTHMQQVASGFADLWDGSLSGSLAWDELGQSNDGDAWTGSNANGTRANGLTLGSSQAWCGTPTSLGSGWLQNITPPTSDLLHFYALSEELSVPGIAINAGFNDAWYFPDTAGQGFFIVVYEDIPLMFLSWFTFDTERPADDVAALLGEPGHRWLTAQGPFEGNTALLDIWVTEGGVFDSAEPLPANHLDGTIELVFEDCTKGVVNYHIESLDLSGAIPIQRVADSNVALCEALAQ